MVGSLTDKPKQRNTNHPGGHLSIKSHQNNDNGMPAQSKLVMAKVKSGGSIYVQMLKQMKAITISDDRESNVEQEQVIKLQPNNKWPVVEPDEDEDDQDDDEDEADQEDDFMLYISRETVDDDLVCIIGHREEYT